MRYRTIADTDLSVSSICMGSTGIGSTIDRDSSFRLLDLFTEQGGTFIDTAAVYANWLPGERNVSEKTIGRWLKQSSHRKQMVIATKGAHPDLESMHVPRMSRSEIESDLDESLRNLGVDVIDLYYLHRDDRSQPVETILSILVDQVKAGKIRHFGCSNWQADRIRTAQEVAADQNMEGFVADQVRWSLAVTDPSKVADRTTVTMDQDLFYLHQESSMAAVAYSSQAGGLFQKMANGQTINDDSYPVADNQNRLSRIQTLAEQTGFTVSQIVLGYLQSQPFVTIPIIGSRTPHQLMDSLTAAYVQLTPEQMAFLNQSTHDRTRPL